MSAKNLSTAVTTTNGQVQMTSQTAKLKSVRCLPLKRVRRKRASINLLVVKLIDLKARSKCTSPKKNKLAKRASPIINRRLVCILDTVKKLGHLRA